MDKAPEIKKNSTFAEEFEKRAKFYKDNKIGIGSSAGVGGLLFFGGLIMLFIPGLHVVGLVLMAAAIVPTYGVIHFYGKNNMVELNEDNKMGDVMRDDVLYAFHNFSINNDNCKPQRRGKAHYMFEELRNKITVKNNKDGTFSILLDNKDGSIDQSTQFNPLVAELTNIASTINGNKDLTTNMNIQDLLDTKYNVNHGEKVPQKDITLMTISTKYNPQQHDAPTDYYNPNAQSTLGYRDFIINNQDAQRQFEPFQPSSTGAPDSNAPSFEDQHNPDAENRGELSTEPSYNPVSSSTLGESMGSNVTVADESYNIERTPQQENDEKAEFLTTDAGAKIGEANPNPPPSAPPLENDHQGGEYESPTPN